MHGVTLGLANGAFLGAYALALWYGSTRVQAGTMTGALQSPCVGALPPWRLEQHTASIVV